MQFNHRVFLNKVHYNTATDLCVHLVKNAFTGIISGVLDTVVIATGLYVSTNDDFYLVNYNKLSWSKERNSYICLDEPEIIFLNTEEATVWVDINCPDKKELFSKIAGNPKSYTTLTNITIRVNNSLKIRLENKAKSSKISVNACVLELLEDMLENDLDGIIYSPQPWIFTNNKGVNLVNRFYLPMELDNEEDKELAELAKKTVASYNAGKKEFLKFILATVNQLLKEVKYEQLILFNKWLAAFYMK